MCNRKTKQWHIKPTLAEYKIMNVYCIVNKLKTVSKWDKMMEEVTAKVLPSLLRTCDCEAVKGCERGWADERGDPLPLGICHIRYWAGKGQSLQCLHGVCSVHESLQLQNWLHFMRNCELKLTCSWAFLCTMMPVFFIFFKLKKKKGVWGLGGLLGY